MAQGDLIENDGGEWILIHDDNSFPTDWQYFRASALKLYIEGRTYSCEVYLDQETNASCGDNSGWTRRLTHDVGGGNTFGNTSSSASDWTGTFTTSPGHCPSWRIRRADSGLWVGNPTIKIWVRNWYGEKGAKIYYYNYSSSLSSSYLTPNYKGNKGLSITWDNRRFMTH